MLFKSAPAGGSKWAILVVAPYCAIPRDYLSDTPYPLLREMDFWCLNIANWVRYPLPKWRCDTPPPPPQKGHLSDTCAIPSENKANGCDTPLCDTISKGYCAIWGAISHWAAKWAILVSNYVLAVLPSGRSLVEATPTHPRPEDPATMFRAVSALQATLGEDVAVPGAQT